MMCMRAISSLTVRFDGAEIPLDSDVEMENQLLGAGSHIIVYRPRN